MSDRSEPGAIGSDDIVGEDEADDETGDDASEADASETATNAGVFEGLATRGEQASDVVVVPTEYVPLEFVSVEIALPSTHPILVLREIEAPRRELHIPIGSTEGVAMAYAARHLPTPRPLTHELMTDILEAYGLTLETVRITAVEASAYRGELVISGASGVRVLDCRVSDGVCLALRQRLPVPITAAAGVLDQASFDAANSD